MIARGDGAMSGDHARFSVRQPGAGEPAIERLMGHFRSQDRAHRDQFFDIDAGIESLALAQKHQVLEHDVAGGAGRERTAAETEPSRMRAPASRAADAFAMPMPLVSCRCTQTGLAPDIFTIALVSSPTCFGPA